MRTTSLGTAALAIGGMLALGQVGRAAETMMLGGVGSLNNAQAVTAPVFTLKGDIATTADTIEVHGPIARAGVGVARVGARVGYGAGRVVVGSARFATGFRPFYGAPGFGFARPWGWNGGWARPWGWNGGWARPWGWGWARPWGWNGGWVRPWGFWPGYAWGGPRVIVNFSGGPFVSGYSPAYYDSSSCYVPASVDYSSYTPQPQVIETGPMPQPNGGYRYDGGPARPTMPQPGIPLRPVTPPVPAADPVARRPVKKIEYPAYGEAPTKVRTSTGDPLLVKNARGQ
jgi:hypothetical protein